MTKPVIIFPIADPHVGSTVGLHPNYIKRDGEWITIDEAGGYRYKHNEFYYLNSKQKRIWNHFEHGIKRIAKFRKYIDADLLLVSMGDVIDGDHHQTHQLTTRSENEQMKAYIEVMQWTLEKVNFTYQKDKLVFIEGTESHTRDNEEIIASQLPAEKFSNGYSCVPFLEMTIHGKLLWMFHHGVNAGYSYTEGAGLYNFLKQIYFDRLSDGKNTPDLVLTAHTHKHNHQVFINKDKEIHGVILPPLQEKTRFTNKLARAIVHPTRLGFAPSMISPNGKIEVMPPYLYEMPLGESLLW